MTIINKTKKIIEQAEHIIEQWDNHDQYRELEADKSLYIEGINEPTDVAIARLLLEYYNS